MGAWACALSWLAEFAAPVFSGHDQTTLAVMKPAHSKVVCAVFVIMVVGVIGSLAYKGRPLEK
ncbi:MAG: hypothetical protein WAM94_04750, partial [Chromatiaceae bacterium]